MTKRKNAMHAIHNAIIGVMLAGCVMPRPIYEHCPPVEDPPAKNAALVVPAVLPPLQALRGCPPDPIMPPVASGTNLAIYAAKLQNVADACRATLGVDTGALPK